VVGARLHCWTIMHLFACSLTSFLFDRVLYRGSKIHGNEVTEFLSSIYMVMLTLLNDLGI
jgi:hypothetical protein